MTSTLKIIMNTHGGRHSSDTKLALIERGMQAAGLAFDLAPTEYPNHAVELARQAVAAGYKIIVAAGGDGTLNEVVNGMMQAAAGPADVMLAILPLGTANDLAHTLKLPTDITAACHRIAAGNSRLIDVGCVNGRYFANNSAVGLEPVVTVTQHRMRWIKGSVRYIVAALKCILAAKPWQARLEWDAGVFEGPVVLVSVGNGPRTGGAFFITPKAQVDDGQFDFVYGLGMSRLRLLWLLPQTFSGRHLGSRMVVNRRTTELAITITPASPIQADGEVFETSATHIKYKILPGRLRVIV